MSTISVDFEILYKFPTYYDYCLYIAEQWFVNGANPTAQAFLSGFAQLLRMLYEPDADYMNSVATIWYDVADVAFKLIPLVIILSIMSMIRVGAGSPSGKVEVRGMVINLVVSLGLAISCYFIATKVLDITKTTGALVLQMSGVNGYHSDGTLSAEEEKEIQDFINSYEGGGFNYNVLALYLFVNTSIGAAANGTAMQVVFIFMRTFLVLVLFLAIGFVAVCYRVGIVFMIAISPIVFVVAGYKEIEWIRDSWIRGFIGLSIMPTVVGILIAMIMRFNSDLVGKQLTSWEAFKTLGMSTGIAALIVLIQSTVLAEMLNYSFGTVQKTVKSGFNIGKNIVLLPVTTAKAVTNIKGFIAGKAAKSAKNKANGGEEDKKDSGEDNKDSDNSGENHNSASELPPNTASLKLEKDIENLKNTLSTKYKFDEEKKEKFEKSAENARRASNAINNFFQEQYGMSMNEASQKMSNKDHVDMLNSAGGASSLLAKDLVRNAASQVDRGAKSTNKETAYDFQLRQEAKNTDAYRSIDPRNDPTGMQRDAVVSNYKSGNAYSNWNRLGNDAMNELNNSNMSDAQLNQFVRDRYSQYSSSGGFNFDFSR